MEKCESTALDWLTTAVMMLDLDGNILRANIAAQTLLEQSEKKLQKNEVPFYIEGLAKWVAAYRAAPHSTFSVARGINRAAASAEVAAADLRVFECHCGASRPASS